MGRKKEEFPIEKVTLNLFQGDFAKLRELHGDRLGASRVVRTLVRAHLNAVSAKVEQRKVTQLDIDLESSNG